VGWVETEPGVLVLPGGRLVRGRALHDGPGQAPDWGLYLLAVRPTLEWPSRWVRWPDLWLPLNGAEARDAIAEAWTRSETAAVSWVRTRYHPRAVETPWQCAWLKR
jgi:hypothetical protein